MQIFNGADNDGCDNGQVILLLSKKEAQDIVKLAELTLDVDDKSIGLRKRDLRRLGKSLFAQLNAAASCF
jgi:hypothetical protein